MEIFKRYDTQDCQTIHWDIRLTIKMALHFYIACIDWVRDKKQKKIASIPIEEKLSPRVSVVEEKRTGGGGFYVAGFCGWKNVIKKDGHVCPSGPQCLLGLPPIQTRPSASTCRRRRVAAKAMTFLSVGSGWHSRGSHSIIPPLPHLKNRIDKLINQ